MTRLDDRLLRLGQQRYEAPLAGRFVVTALGFFVIGVASLLLGGNEGSALAFIGIAVVGVLACELVGLLRRHQRMG